MPITSWSSDSDRRLTIPAPATAVSAASASSAAIVPRIAARQLRVVPTARTMVKASTNSTAAARKLLAATPMVVAGMSTAVYDVSQEGVLAAGSTLNRIHIPDNPCPGTPQKIRKLPLAGAVNRMTSVPPWGSPCVTSFV